MVYARLVTCDLTLETLVTFLTIENNNINFYILILEKRVMGTAFAILAMFNFGPVLKLMVVKTVFSE